MLVRYTNVICVPAGIHRPAMPILAILIFAFAATAQTDPGPRPGAAAAGGPLSGLSATDVHRWTGPISNIENVPNNGPGPRFNSNSWPLVTHSLRSEARAPGATRKCNSPIRATSCLRSSRPTVRCAKRPSSNTRTVHLTAGFTRCSQSTADPTLHRLQSESGEFLEPVQHFSAQSHFDLRPWGSSRQLRTRSSDSIGFSTPARKPRSVSSADSTTAATTEP